MSESANYLALAKEPFEREDYAAAPEQCSKAIAQNPQNPDAYYNRGMAANLEAEK